MIAFLRRRAKTATAFACSIALLAAPAGVRRAAAVAATLDSLARYADGLAAFGFTGQVIVARGDSLLLSRAMGVADRSGRPVTPHTRFAAGSVTKSFTAAIAVRLAREHRFSLDDPLERLLPDVPEALRPVRLRELLSHTAGLAMDAEQVRESDDRDAVVRTTLDQSPSGPRGTFSYSNAGFQLVAAACERATGRPFARLVDSLLLQPGRMWASGTGSAFARRVDDAAEGRNEWALEGSVRDWRQAWAGTGAGDLVTTAQDLWRWARAFQGAGPLEAADVDSLVARRAATGEGLSYGFGLWLVPAADGPDVVSIGGDVPGFHTGVWVERRAPWRIVVVVSAGERFARRLPVAAAQRALWRIAEGAPQALPPEPATWPRDRLERLAGDWRVSPGGSLRLVSADGGLRLELAGPAALALVNGRDSSEAVALADGRTLDVLNAAAQAESSLDAVLLPVERTAWRRTLLDGVRAHVRAHGALRDVEVEGSLALPWLANARRSWAVLRSGHGETRVSLAWLSGALLDVAFDDPRPAPLLLPVAPLAQGGLAAWDLLDGTTIRVDPFVDRKGEGLRLAGAGAVCVARRIASAR